ncbi:MAG TPA: methyltransferase domain-containing protein [Solirubrobacteraceae bacterium]|nr:methyltransferase domain-containing protein [Solirubrobacteraceae bacterium]
MSIDFEGIKQGHRTMWASGDYPRIARRIESVAELVAERVGAREGIALLDVATGSGNVALAAAAAGARVTGLDLTPELLQAARERAGRAGLEVSFVEGDAEALPFADDSFDRVTSCFGVIFAPRQELAARELLRVTRPGGVIAVAAWTPAGLLGQTFRTLSGYLPPPPPELRPPTIWGEERDVRALLGATGAELTCERLSVTFAGESAKAMLDEDEQILGPAIVARRALEPQGLYEPMRADMLALYERFNEAGDGSFRAGAEYLLTLARIPDAG